jgi:L-2-hydroxyglutarate oxidase
MIVIGGGIVGLATALRLGQKYPAAQITLLEKESTVGKHQTGNNSGVLHAGLYYVPGSYKARLAVRGIQQMREFCVQNSIAHETCGKLVVAVNESEVARLKTLLERGTQNGLQGLKWMNGQEMREIEPHVAGIAAVHVPEEGIVDYPAVCRAMVKQIEARGDSVVTQAQVTELKHSSEGWRVHTLKGDYLADYIVNCAGLQSDRVSLISGQDPGAKIIPFRGEYYMLKKERQSLVKHLIYPVPDPQFPFLGVHFTRMIHGGVEAGPNAVLAFAREGYKMSQINPRDLIDSLTYPGLWRFLKKYPSMAWWEIRRSLSRELFCQSLQRLVPEIQSSDLEPGGAGVRAQAMLRDGTLIQDFHIARGISAIHVLNAPSPAATSSLAIGEEIVAQIEQSLH